MKLAVASCLAAFLVALAVALYMGSTYNPPAVVPAPTEQIQEDDPRWDCHTMGNRTCGKEQER